MQSAIPYALFEAPEFSGHARQLANTRRRSCETGNVLYKQFSQAEDVSVCQFECLPGYVKVSKGAELDGGDCEAGPLPASVQNYWSPRSETLRSREYERHLMLHEYGSL